MKNNQPMFERDLLYPTDSVFEPGSVHVSVYRPDDEGKLCVLVDPKTEHSPVKYIDAIISILQIDVFDRIHIDVKSGVNLFFICNDEMKKEFGPQNYLEMNYEEGEKKFSSLDSLDK